MGSGTPIKIDRGRTEVKEFRFGYSLAGDSFKSEIRQGTRVDSKLIATWDIEFATDGSDGVLLLSLDDSITKDIPAGSGYMDIKRVTDGEPVSMFEHPLTVVIRNVVTE